MPRLILANQATAARRRAYFDCRDATDGITPETGEAGGQPQISTDGGAFTDTGIGTLTHLGNGRYYADVAQSAVDTAGRVIETRYKSANTVETPGDTFQVVAFDPDNAVRLGLTALPNAAADAAGGLPISDAGGLDLDAQKADVAAILVDTGTTLDGRIPAALVGGRMDANVGAISADATAADNAEAFFDGTGYAGTNNVIPLVTTATNLTNAPTNGDLTATMKTSITTAATAATPTAAAVTAPFTVGTNNDKTGYGLSSAAVQAIWDAATSALTTVGSVGKWILDKLDVVVSTRLASASYTAPLDAAGTRSAVGLASANLDTQIGTLATAANLATVAGYLDTEMAATQASAATAASQATTAATQATAAATSAADLQTRLPAALVSGRMDSSVGAFPLVIDTGKTGAAVLKDLLAQATGNVTKTGNAFEYKDRDGNTLFTITIATGTRTRS